ncbi:MAG TPA: flagellar hook capping FlgD N-terminal domain-containing protein [Acetobacteraceae bacterium]|nr:flagellar hook capping FlgD N-terminal domain-containing protein [Acetobacteraceae bacterium]
MSMASVAAQQTGANAATTSGAAAAGTSTATGQNALSALSGNFSDFLNMLMTQLKNQDPTSPLDTNQFTTELVQFSGVEQQINTNTSLTQLIQLTQAGEVMQASSMTGRQVTVSSSQIPLQNGSGAVQFTDKTAGPVAIAITNANGQQVRGVALNAAAGQNGWTWDGKDNAGNAMPDGAYNIVVAGVNSDGGTTALPFTVTGTASGVQNTTANGVQLELGALSVNFGSIVSVGQ